MTIGERIAQIRKVKGLSQEAFGESLGVTRQSISKWEANISIPEMDKLLAMCKLYEVSVSWLLGEETEDVNESQEMTEAQWRMVEKIAEKYISSMPQKKTKINTWYKIAGVGVVCILFVWLIYLSNSMNTLNNQFTELQKDMFDYQKQVSNKLSEVVSATNVIEIGMEEQESILKEGWVICEADPSTETVTLDMRAIPKLYTEGMWAEFVIMNEGEVYTIESVEVDQLNRFSAIYQMPYSDYIRVIVVLHVGNEEQTQEIFFSDCERSRTRVRVFDDTRDAFRGNVLKYNKPKELKITLYNDFMSNTATTESVQWKFYKNGELVQTLDGVLGEEKEYIEPTGIHIDTGVLPNTKIATAELNLEIIKSCEKGDSFWVVVVIKDNFGREYVVDIDTYRVSDEMDFEIEEVSLDYEDSKWFE